MFIKDITNLLETIAPPSLQEDYDNAGLITGNIDSVCSGAIISLDCTEDIVQEAIDKNCNLVIAHHPIVFKGLKKLSGSNYVERTIIKAIKNDIAIFAIHTNLDNVITGVNGKIAEMMGLQNVRILLPKKDVLQKLEVFVPAEFETRLSEALFTAGAGNIGKYSECSFKSAGVGSFNPNENAKPISGTIGERSNADEIKIEVIFPAWLQYNIIKAMKAIHPYEEVAYYISQLQNYFQGTGSGVVGELLQPITENELCNRLAKVFQLNLIKHTAFVGKPVRKIAMCGGAGSFLINHAKGIGADVYITADIKYHDFFDADGKMLLIDIGHYESEQFTVDMLFDLLSDKFPNFAFLKTGINTNPVQYFVP